MSSWFSIAKQSDIDMAVTAIKAQLAASQLQCAEAQEKLHKVEVSFTYILFLFD